VEERWLEIGGGAWWRAVCCCFLWQPESARESKSRSAMQGSDGAEAHRFAETACDRKNNLVLLHLFREDAKLLGGGFERGAGGAADVRDHFIIHVLDKAFYFFFSFGGGVVNLFFPIGHKTSSTYSSSIRGVWKACRQDEMLRRVEMVNSKLPF
jgi:hypothetical protein